MKIKSLSLKITIIVTGLLGLVLYFWAIPFMGHFIEELSPEYSHAYMPWLLLFWVTAIPCYAVLVLLWQIVRSIDSDELFRQKNAGRFRLIAKFVFVDIIIFMAANIVFLFLNINHPSVFLASAFVCLAGAAFGISMKALAGFFEKAAMLQEESDLTI